MPRAYYVVAHDERKFALMPEEKKIIIDEDWKSRVEAEKEEAAKAAQPTSAERPALGAQDVGDMPMPPASLELLLTTLATEALMAMGQMPHPATGKVEIQRNQAKYLIDLIDVVREKTKGNLTHGEQQLIESMLHQLRIVFVETVGQSAEQASTEGDS